jgi:DNA-binding beta-propeller fold protein YncE
VKKAIPLKKSCRREGISSERSLDRVATRNAPGAISRCNSIDFEETLMKRTKRTSAHLAVALLLSVLSWGISSAAATTYPLNSPQGLALDAKGNLYVANNSGNQVLVYNPSYVQLPGKTISEHVINPTSLAFDGSGNLWVANAGNQTITEYSPTGVQKPSLIILGSTPYAIAIDGIGDLWVETNFATVGIYPQYSSYPLVTLFNPTDAFTGIATYQGNAAIGTNTNAQVRQVATALSGAENLYYVITETGFVMAYDTAGNLYAGNIDNTLSVNANSGGGTKKLAHLGFFPFGIAVDSTRGRIYVADGIGNKIAVYNTAGTLLHTIE